MKTILYRKAHSPILQKHLRWPQTTSFCRLCCTRSGLSVMQTSASGPGDGVAPPAHDSDDVSTSATGPSGASSAPTSVPAGDSTTINLSAAPPGVPTPLSGSAGTAAAAPALQQEDNDLKATLLLFRHLDFCSLGDIGDLIKEFSDNLSARFNAITLRSDLKQFVLTLRKIRLAYMSTLLACGCISRVFRCDAESGCASGMLPSAGMCASSFKTIQSPLSATLRCSTRASASAVCLKVWRHLTGILRKVHALFLF